MFIYCSSPSHRDPAQERPGRREEGHDDLLHLLHQGKPAAKAHLEQGARPDAGGGGEKIIFLWGNYFGYVIIRCTMYEEERNEFLWHEAEQQIFRFPYSLNSFEERAHIEFQPKSNISTPNNIFPLKPL